MNLADSLRVDTACTIAFAGAGGKTTAMFNLARNLTGPVFLTTTTHLGAGQVSLADKHFIAGSQDDLATCLQDLPPGVYLVTGSITPDDRASALTGDCLEWLRSFCRSHAYFLLVEADGSKRLPLKAPAEHEPAIPAWADVVLYVAGLSAIGKPLNDEHVHRSGKYAALTGLEPGSPVTWDSVEKLLSHPDGGLKNIPQSARRILLLNQAECVVWDETASQTIHKLNTVYETVILASLGMKQQVDRALEPAAAVLLAAGASTRLGQPKALLQWRGKSFVRCVAETALEAGLAPVIVVLGAVQEPIRQALEGLPLTFVVNEHWEDGQGSSVALGAKALMGTKAGSAFYLMADQPQTSPELLKSLIRKHEETLAAIIFPEYEGKRGTPVLFDRITFSHLSKISGEMGGRNIFSKFPATAMPWRNESILIDVDTLEDYKRLLDKMGKV